MSTHTPGPWQATANSYLAYVHHDGGPTVASVNVGSDEGQANLRVILAAPTLITALELVRDALRRDRDCLDAFTALEVEHALALAEGATP